MVSRMDIVKLDGGNMKKIYSIFERIVCIFSILLLSLIAAILFLKYNSEININDVEKIEVITLTKEEQKKYIGYKHILKKYLKFQLKYGKSKYVYVGNYSNHQIKKIIEYAKINKN